MAGHGTHSYRRRAVAKEEVEGALCGGDEKDPLTGDRTCHLSSYLDFPTVILYYLGL